MRLSHPYAAGVPVGCEAGRQLCHVRHKALHQRRNPVVCPARAQIRDTAGPLTRAMPESRHERRAGDVARLQHASCYVCSMAWDRHSVMLPGYPCSFSTLMVRCNRADISGMLQAQRNASMLPVCLQHIGEDLHCKRADMNGERHLWSTVVRVCARPCIPHCPALIQLACPVESVFPSRLGLLLACIHLDGSFRVQGLRGCSC